jgi:rare lipoprotein A
MIDLLPSATTHLPSSGLRVAGRRGAAAAMLVGCAFAFAGCNTTSQSAAAPPAPPSSAVASAGDVIPPGGGRQMVGRPYTIAGRTYTPQLDPDYRATGLASWYGGGFHGRRTANGEIFDMNDLTAAHPTMPLPSYARVTNTGTGQSLIVRVNDRGPFHGNRVIDVSRRTADLLGIRRAGVGSVSVEYVGRAPVDGDDSAFLLASYRDADEAPATMMASAAPAAEATTGDATLVAAAAPASDPVAADSALPGVVMPAGTPVLVAESAPVEAETTPAAPASDTPTLVAMETPAATGDVPLPRSRPFTAEPVLVADAADPAEVAPTAAPVLVAATAAAPAVIPAAYTVPAGTPAIAFQPAATVPAGTRLVWPTIDAPQTIGAGRNSFAEERLNAGFEAFDAIEGGAGLARLASDLSSLAGEAEGLAAR